MTVLLVLLNFLVQYFDLKIKYYYNIYKMITQIDPSKFELNSYVKHTPGINKLLKEHNVSLGKPDVVIPILEEKYKNLNTLNMKLNTIIEYIRIHRKKRVPNYIKKYENFRTKVIEMKNKTPKTITEDEKIEDYGEGVNNFITHLKNNGYKTTREEFITSFYMLMEPRRKKDYFKMYYKKYDGDINDKKFDFHDLDKDKNHLIQVGEHWFVHFGDFKNVAKIGTQTFLIDNDHMIKILNKRTFTEGNLIYPMEEKTFDRDLQKVSKEYLGKELTANKFRIHHSTYKFGQYKHLFDDLRKDAERMGHNMTTKINHYIR